MVFMINDTLCFVFCITDICLVHMELEGHVDFNGLSSFSGAAVSSWRAADAILGQRQVLYPGHLCHPPAAGLGHLGLASFPMLHTAQTLSKIH